MNFLKSNSLQGRGVKSYFILDTTKVFRKSLPLGKDKGKLKKEIVGKRKSTADLKLSSSVAELYLGDKYF